MKSTRVTVQFENGLHARTATHLVKLVKKFKSQVVFRLGNRVANGRSILGILLLAATFHTQLEVQASGQDEDAAISATTVFFQQTDEDLQSRGAGENLPPNRILDQQPRLKSQKCYPFSLFVQSPFTLFMICP